MAKKKLVDIKKLDYIALVKIAKTRVKKNQKLANAAYDEIEGRVKSKIMYIVGQFHIPGCNRDDIYQEALYALRFKAIPDYDKDKGNYGPYPFDNFAVLCIRRHLSTLLKSSFQNKKKALNTSLSINKNRNDSSSDMLFLSDILTDDSETVADFLQNKEYYSSLFSNLFKKLSKFEKKVFVLYTKKYSYEEITAIINANYKKNKIKRKINIKSVDNALSRIKIKGREVFVQHKKKDGKN